MVQVSDAPRFAPKWPDILPKSQFRITYDRPADTLFVDFYGEARPASSEPLDTGDRDYIFVRVDPLTDEVVGVQIEDFLAYAVKVNPNFVEPLTIAAMRGMTEQEAEDLRQWARVQMGEGAEGYDLVRDVERLGA